jgi:2'-5' RNA ligase
MRLFTALNLPPEMLPKLEQVLTALRPTAQIKWSPRENLHITIKFIGEWPEARIDQVDAALKGLRHVPPIDVQVRELGWFPHAQSPRVLWAGVDGGDALRELAALTDKALVKIGVAAEPYPYSPHLTLARLKGSAGLQDLRAKVEELHSVTIGQFRATGFYLYSSEPGSRASIYRKLRTYRFDSKHT